MDERLDDVHQWLQQFVFPMLSLEVQQTDNQVHKTICDAFLDPMRKRLPCRMYTRTGFVS